MKMFTMFRLDFFKSLSFSPKKKQELPARNNEFCEMKCCFAFSELLRKTLMIIIIIIDIILATNQESNNDDGNGLSLSLLYH